MSAIPAGYACKIPSLIMAMHHKIITINAGNSVLVCMSSLPNYLSLKCYPLQ